MKEFYFNNPRDWESEDDNEDWDDEIYEDQETIA